MGIHVHARKIAGGSKSIDRNFDAVQVTVDKDLLEQESVIITKETAVAYYISRFLERKIESLFCPKCGTPHLDSDWFAVKPHRTHLCHGCNELFRLPDKSISNPLSVVQLKLGYKKSSKPPRRATKRLNIAQAEYPGGLQIWASNPALLWTSRLSEEEGIHIHGWTGAERKPTLDDTFDTVVIDGVELNEEQLRYYMAQSALAYLRGKVHSIKCPNCQAAQFDAGEAAFRPKKERICHCCRFEFEPMGRRKLLVSNPFVDTIAALKQARRHGGHA
ncbi:hypothetical protein [Sphingobium sp. CFD-2]|uniref:hypothetical protein n=1 Tax=Sphingobium sp. CFD-2 TaxID=2878542 RepID=UPI00214AFC85|nr:hypothetical protein [Sphingobium sp. CFD-2]